METWVSSTGLRWLVIAAFATIFLLTQFA